MLLKSSGFDEKCTFNYCDVVSAVSRLHKGKGDGHKGLMSEHLKHACDELFVQIALLFTSMAVHGFVPEDLQISTIIPIRKGKMQILLILIIIEVSPLVLLSAKFLMSLF